MTQGTNPRNQELQTRCWICGRHQNKYYDTYSLPLKPLYSISSSYETQFLAQADCFFQILLQPSSETHPVSYTKTTLGSYPNNKFSGSHSIETENLWSPIVMPVQRQFTFHPGTQYDWINNGDLTYKNTTHNNIIMHYLELSSSTALLLCHRPFFLPLHVSVSFSSH